MKVTTTNRKKLSWPTLVFIGLGAVLIGIGLLIGWMARLQTHNLEKVEGTVEGLMLMPTGKRPCKAPVVSYKIYGEPYQLQPKSSNDCHLFPPSVGDKIDVFYPEEQPGDGRLKNFTLRWALPGFFILTGLFLGGVGGAVTFVVDRSIKGSNH